MRTLDSGLVATIEATVTTPFYLIQLDFAATLRLSTRGDVTWDGYTWISNGARVESVGGGVGSQSKISLANADLSAGAIALFEDIRGDAVQIWAAYGDSPMADTDVTLIFSGVIDAIPLIGMRVQLDCLYTDKANAFSPRLFAGPPIMNHLPPPGTVVSGVELESK